MKHHALSLTDQHYPTLLRSVSGAPETLYVLGEILPVDSRAIAVVGSRTPTSYGVRVARRFVAQLVEQHFTIVSGLARGIDEIAHKTALEYGGRTIAVLGCGFDHMYPPENSDLARNIISSGAVVTEHDHDVSAEPHYFLERNRIIAGLSLGVLVIEGKARSGTVSTAAHAANIGRDVFAIPGPIDSELSETPNALIKEGAIFTTSIDDILAVL